MLTHLSPPTCLGSQSAPWPTVTCLFSAFHTARVLTAHTVEELLTAPGMLHELELREINGRIQRVYKHAWPSLREFWLVHADQHKDKTYLVFEDSRITFADALQQSVRLAGIFYDVYAVRKDDRVAIVSRNYIEYILAFWACQLIGAIPVLVNACAQPFLLLPYSRW
jgi:hypothetical protein